jgi:hypothetical protein
MITVKLQKIDLVTVVCWQVFKQGDIIQFRLKMEFKLGNVLTTLNKIIPMSFKHVFKAKLN